MPELESLDEFQYHHRLKETGGIALVLFSSPTCGTCRVVEGRLPREAPAGVRLFKVDAQLSPALARALEVFHLPALFLYRDGEYHAPLDCEISTPALNSALTAALAAPAREEP
jgi:thioredoxin-like negative regulator of GroEL